MTAILSALATNILLWVWIIAAGTGWLTTRQKPAKRRILVSVLFAAWLLSTRPAADLAFLALESGYIQPDVADLREQGYSAVVVLTGGGYPIQTDLLSSTLPHASAYRFMAGMELCALLTPDCTIIFSGSAGRGNTEVLTAETMQQLAARLAPDMTSVSETKSASTRDHPANIRDLLGDEPFVLVTSAYHMPRAMRNFRQERLNPAAYPVDFYRTSGRYSWQDWLPNAGNIGALQVALREYLATIYDIAR